MKSDGAVSVGYQTLLVIYTERPDACRDFYASIGLPLVRERHGAGPVHYAAELAGGMVIELYPGRPQHTTGRLRLGFTVSGGDLPPGDHALADPDGFGTGERGRFVFWLKAGSCEVGTTHVGLTATSIEAVDRA